jgi:hypothetical protein
VRKEGNGLSTFTIIREKTTREIAKIERMSIRDISTILKEEEARRQKNKDQQRQEEVSSNAYKLFSEGKTPIEVAIALNLREPEATKLYREYWKLKRLHILNSIFKETNGKLGPFLKLYKQLINQRGMTVEKVINAVDIAIHKLPYMECLYKQLKDEVDKMQRTRQQLDNYLHKLKEEIASAKALLSSYHTLCDRKRQESEHHNNDISRLENIISQFKNNNEEYLKIKKGVEEEVRIVLTDSKVLLQFALASIIEAIRRNYDKYNNSLVYNISSSIPAQQSPLLDIEGYKDMILEEANRLYDKLLKHFINSLMDNAAAFKRVSLQSNLSSQPNKSNTYTIEESVIHDNDNDSKGDIDN